MIQEHTTYTNLAGQAETEELVRRCIGDDRKAQQELYKQHYGKMMSLCRRYFPEKDEAMGVLNHGFLKVFRSMDQYRFNGPIEAWIQRIIYHTAIDYLRKKNRQLKEQKLDGTEEDDLFVDPAAVKKLENDDLMKLLAKLPEATRAVFNMYVIEGYKHGEIAEMLQISTGTSKWHLNSARQKLKLLIKP